MIMRIRKKMMALSPGHEYIKTQWEKDMSMWVIYENKIQNQIPLGRRSPDFPAAAIILCGLHL